MAAAIGDAEGLLPWSGASARIFGQAVRAALVLPEVLQVELAIDAALLARHGGKAEGRRDLVVVASAARRDAALRGELSPHGAPPPRPPHPPPQAPPAPVGPQRRDVDRLRLPLHLGRAPIGELWLWLGRPRTRDGWRAVARHVEGDLCTDLLGRQLRHARLQARTLLEAAPDPMLIVDARSGVVVGANGRAATLLRRREHDLPGVHLKELLVHGARTQPLEMLRNRPRSPPLVWLLRRRGADPVSVTVSAARVAEPAPRWHLVLRDVSAAEGAHRELMRAKDTLAAIARAGAQLQGETERSAVFEAAGRALAGLGYFSAVLMPEVDAAAEGRAPLWAVAHLAGPPDGPEPPEALRALRFDPNQFPPLQRALTLHRPVFSWAHERLSLESPRRASRRAHVPDGTLWAPLTAEGAAFGALWITGPTLRPADVEGIAAFALQVGLALERSRLYGAVVRRSHDLEGEVERRTRELTLAVRALREVDRRKDNFMANVSHELRTPLVTILGYTQLVLSGRLGDLSDSQRLSLATAMRNGHKLKDFIDELLDYSRHELTRESLRREVFSVRKVIDQAAAAIYPKLLERGLLLQTRVASGTPEVFAEVERILQVLSNLLTNAERHCRPQGRLWIAAAGNAERVRISVSDDGEGIPPEHRERIFDRLYQVGDRAMAREKGAGLGLGLAIAKSIVEAHGGRIWIDTRRKSGTRFCFELPAAKVLDPPAG